MKTAEEAYKIIKGNCHSRRETIELLDPEKINSEINDKIDTLSKEKMRIDTEIETLKSKLL